MIKILLNGLLVLAALSITPSVFAEENIQPETTEISTTSVPVVETTPTTPAPRIRRGEVCPPVPLAWQAWPAETVSLVGGCQTTSKQQRFHALKWKLPIASSATDYWSLVTNGSFVCLENGEYLQVVAKWKCGRLETVRFLAMMSKDYSAAACGKLVVTDFGRPETIKRSGSSPDTVHPFGMAVDIRLLRIEPRCADWIRAYVLEKEALKLVDGTEHVGTALHMHLVVPPLNQQQFWSPVRND